MTVLVPWRSWSGRPRKVVPGTESRELTKRIVKGLTGRRYTIQVRCTGGLVTCVLSWYSIGESRRVPTFYHEGSRTSVKEVGVEVPVCDNPKPKGIDTAKIKEQRKQ